MTTALPLASPEVNPSVTRTTNPGSGSASGLRSPRGATSVRPSKISKVGGFIDEGHRRYLLLPVRERWERRTTELNAVIGPLVQERPFAPELPALKRQRAYAVARVARLHADIAPRLDWCGTESLPVRCGCGYVGARKTCRQWWLCDDCRKKRGSSLAADIRRGLDAALSAEKRDWARDGAKGMEPTIVLLTLTQKHSGNLVADQTALAEGWRKLYIRMHEEHGRFPYAGVWEVTPGWDEWGHVHLHIACVWRYRDWGRIREQWMRACPTSQRITFVAKRKDGKPSSPSSVAKYLGKYLSKGVDVAAFNPHLRAEVSAAFYNQRSVISSVGFFHREDKYCRKCGECFRLEEVPKESPLDRIAPMTLALFFHGLEPPTKL